MKNEIAKIDVKNHHFKHLRTFILLGSSIFLLTHSFPNDLFNFGIFFFAYFALIPLFLLLYSSSYKKSFFLGFVFGSAWYALSFSWIFAFPLLAALTLLFFTGISYGLLCILLRFCLKQKKHLVPLLCASIWVLFEWTKTLGISAFPFGIIAYTQAFVPELIGLCRETGVLGISFGIVWLNSVLSCFFLHRFKKKKSQTEKASFKISKTARAFALQFFVFTLIFATDFILYAFTPELKEKTELKIAIIQRNINPITKNTNAYLQSFLTQKRLTESVLAEKPDLIAWPETALVPSIDFHSRYKIDADLLGLVNDFKELVKNSNTRGFLIGNDHGVRIISENSYKRLDYNSALYFKNGDAKTFERYDKSLLVPFVEYYPFGDFLPELKKFCLNINGIFWEKGTAYKTFTIKDLKFSTPICYEGCFGAFISGFTHKGADFFVFLVDDAWSIQKKEAYQHYAFAIFRACEQNKPVIRVSNSGPSALIAKDGRIVKATEEGKEAALIVNFTALKNSKTTFYAEYESAFILLCALFFFSYILLLIGKKITIQSSKLTRMHLYRNIER